MRSLVVRRPGQHVAASVNAGEEGSLPECRFVRWPSQGMAVVALVGNHDLYRSRLDERLGPGNISVLASGEDQPQVIVQRGDACILVASAAA